MAAMQSNSVNLTGEGESVRVFGLRISASLLPMLGVQPITAACSEHHRQADRNRHAEIHGDRGGGAVLQFMEPAQLYVPLAFTPAQLDPHARGHQNLDVVGRLKHGVTLDPARAEMKLVAARMSRNLPDWYPPDWNIELDPLAGQVAGELRTPLLVLQGAVGMRPS
jgi:hypothetical protein